MTAGDDGGGRAGRSRRVGDGARVGVYSDRDAIAELRAFLSMPGGEALASPSPLLRALAVLDARVGKRRLAALAAAPDLHPLVRTLLAVRCDAEGVRVAPPAGRATSPRDERRVR
jgi:hypothetical protein